MDFLFKAAATTALAFASLTAAAPTAPEIRPTHQQETWIAALEFCESRGDTSAKVFDSNDKYSYGAFQFQMQTFLSYGKKYGLVATSTTEKDGEKLIYDYGLQRRIVAIMLSNGLSNHWRNCAKKLGTYPKEVREVRITDK